MDLRVAAYAVVTDDQGRVLLAHWNQGGRSGWTMPGGGMDPGEHPADTVRREVEEETGYVAEVTGLLGIDSAVIPAKRRLTASDLPLQALRIIYRARVTGGTLRNEADGSTDEAGWFTLDEVAALHRVALVDVALGMAGLS
jgi:8-oxo-dGTP diphosphatase